MNRIFILSASILALTAVPALAQDMHKEGPPSSKLIQQIARSAPQGTFYLTRDQQSEVVDYSRNRDMSLCVARNDTTNRIPGSDANIPLSVNWTRMGSEVQRQAVVFPGNCLALDAAHVTIKPAQDLPAGRMITGQIQTAGDYFPTNESYAYWDVRPGYPVYHGPYQARRD